MKNAKKLVTELLQSLPEDCAIEDLQYSIYVVETIQKRRRQAENWDHIVSQAEAQYKLSKWEVNRDRLRVASRFS